MSATIPPVSDLPYKTIIDACFDGTKGMHDFSTEVMIPLCKGLLSRSQQENAVIDTYYKMTLLLRSSLALNTLDHFQTVASLTRSLFELWLDLKILAQDTTGDAVKRYDEFPEIEKFRAAERMVNFSAAQPQSWGTDISAQQAFLTDSGRAQRVWSRRSVGGRATGGRQRRCVPRRCGSCVRTMPISGRPWPPKSSPPSTAFRSLARPCESG
jgi:hypothetical protein